MGAVETPQHPTMHTMNHKDAASLPKDCGEEGTISIS